MSNNSKGINIILYPREYNKRGHDSLHSVRGITSSGEEINVKLRVPEKYKSHDNYPKIVDLASTDVKSRRYCLASDLNSKDSREGILLFSGAIKEPTKKNKVATYTAAWVEVLSNSSDSPSPIYGLGRMEINKKSKKTASLNKQLDFHIQNNSAQDLIVNLQAEVDNPKNFSYSSIHYICMKTMLFSTSEKTRIRDYFIQSINNYTKIGKIGGIMIRTLNKDGLVIKNSYNEFFPRYSVVSGGIQVGKITYDSLKEDIDEILNINSSVQVEIMPLVKVTTGPKSSEYYGEKERFNRLKKIFFDDDGNPKICKMVSRITEYSESGTSLLYRTFPLTIPLGHPAKLGKDGLLSFRFDSESNNSQFENNNLNLSGIKAGLTTNTSMIKRAYWLIGENSSLIEYHENILSDEKDKSQNTKENNLSSINESKGESIEDLISSREDDSITDEVENNETGNDEVKYNENIETENQVNTDEQSILVSKEDVKEEPQESSKDVVEEENKEPANGLTGMAAFLARKNS